MTPESRFKLRLAAASGSLPTTIWTGVPSPARYLPSVFVTAESRYGRVADRLAALNRARHDPQALPDDATAQSAIRVACDAMTIHRPSRRTKTSVNRSATVWGALPPTFTVVRPVTIAVSPYTRIAS